MDEIERVADWMRRERQARGMSTATLALQVRQLASREGLTFNLSQQSISAFEQGKAKRVPNWMRYVERILGDDGAEPESPFARNDAAVQIAELPTFVGAGGGGTGDGDQSTFSFSRAIVRDELRASPEDLLAVIVEGSSMEPAFFSGDRLLIDKRRVGLAQPGAFCLWDGDGYVVKYVERVPGSEPPKVRVISANPVFSTFERLVDEVRIMGRVVWFARKV